MKGSLFFAFVFSAFLLQASTVFAEGPLKLKFEDDTYKLRILADSASKDAPKEISADFLYDKRCKYSRDGVFEHLDCVNKDLKDLSLSDTKIILNWQGKNGATFVNKTTVREKDGSLRSTKVISTNLRDYYQVCSQNKSNANATCQIVTPSVCSGFDREVAKAKRALKGKTSSNELTAAYDMVFARSKEATAKFRLSASTNELGLRLQAEDREYIFNLQNTGEALCQDFKNIADQPKGYMFPSPFEALSKEPAARGATPSQGGTGGAKR